MLPYTSLLHRSTRESLGISLKGSVVVLDEAHNIIETVNSVHSAALAQPQIALALSHLSQYLARYRSRLKGKNILYIKQLLHVLRLGERTFKIAFQINGGGDNNLVPNARTVGGEWYLTFAAVTDFIWSVWEQSGARWNSVELCNTEGRPG